MNLTPKMLAVLRAVEKRPGCGANYIVDVLFPDTRRHMSLRAGQYMGRLIRRGLIRKTYDEYTGKRGERIISSVSYTLTPLARELLHEHH